MKILTKAQSVRADRDRALYDDYGALIDNGVSKMAAMEKIKDKYSVFSTTGIYKILQREQERRDGQ